MCTNEAYMDYSKCERKYNEAAPAAAESTVINKNRRDEIKEANDIVCAVRAQMLIYGKRE